LSGKETVIVDMSSGGALKAVRLPLPERNRCRTADGKPVVVPECSRFLPFPSLQPVVIW